MIFDYNQQLNPQQQHRNLQQSDNKRLLGLLGYNALGEQNTWGKIMALNPLGIGSGVRNRIASGVAGGDADEVIRGQQDEASAMALSKLAFAVNLGKDLSGAGLLNLPKIGRTPGQLSDIYSGEGMENPVGGSSSFLKNLLNNENKDRIMNQLNSKVSGDNTSGTLRSKISPLLNAIGGDTVSSFAQAMASTSGYLKSDEEELGKMISGTGYTQNFNTL